MIKNTQKTIGLISLLLAFGVSAPALATAPTRPTPGNYDDCIALVESDPAQALDYAQTLESETGGIAAMHCRGLALSALGRHDEAGALLFDLAERIPFADEGARADVYAQAADDFLAAENMSQARIAIDHAIEHAPDEADYHLTRARLLALDGEWEAVRNDLSAALAENPNSAAALTLRATANRTLGHPQAAMVDIDHAIELAPHSLDALLERGRVRAAMGNVADARLDWEALIRYAKATGRSDDPAAKAAQTYLTQSPTPATP